MKKLPWVAGFESEVILGDLGISRFEQDLERFGAMDEASPAFCRAVAKSLSEFTDADGPPRSILRNRDFT
jgi:hypothetical protein